MTTPKSDVTRGDITPQTMVVVDNTNSMVHDVHELNAAVTEVQRLKAETAVSMWKLGKHIAHIHDRQLWMRRHDAHGTPKCNSFDAFVRAELGMTPKNVYSLMTIAEHFSEDDVRKWGTTKLGLLLQAPPEDRSALQDKMDSGELKTTRELETVVRARKKRTRYQKPTKRAMPLNAGRVRPIRNLVVANILDSYTAKFWTSDDSTKRAKNIIDRPRAIVPLTDAIEMNVTLEKDKADHLVLRVKMLSREESSDLYAHVTALFGRGERP